jgi:hypothetical protein
MFDDLMDVPSACIFSGSLEDLCISQAAERATKFAYQLLESGMHTRTLDVLPKVHWKNGGWHTVSVESDSWISAETVAQSLPALAVGDLFGEEGRFTEGKGLLGADVGRTWPSVTVFAMAGRDARLCRRTARALKRSKDS